MFRAVGRTLIAQTTRPQTALALRAFSTNLPRLSDKPPSLYGPGSPAGAVPTDQTQATGLDRLQILGLMEGVDVFGQKPLTMTKPGTLSEPTLVPSLAEERIVGCTGFPTESHDILWIMLRHHRKEGRGRCKECGNVFKLDYKASEHDDSHHH